MPSEIELVEVFRLGESAAERGIVRNVGHLLAGQWLAVSRFKDVEHLTTRDPYGSKPTRPP